MYPTFTIGSLAFPTAGLLYIFGAWLCLSLIEASAKRLRQPEADIYALSVAGLAAGVIGARLAFVAEYWAAFRTNLLQIVWPLNSGYTIWTGVLIGVLVAFFYGRYLNSRSHNLPLLSTLDALAPGLIFGFMIISLADFLAGPGYGELSNLPWAVSQFGIRRHPVQLYELLGGALALAFWWRQSTTTRPAGWLFAVSTAVYSASRLFTDAFRENALLTPNGYHIIQIVALGVLLLSLILLRQYLKVDSPAPQP